MNTQLAGREGEARAAQYLRRHGWTVLDANYRSRFGEIDLIARKRNTVAFVEVKLRRDARFAAAAEAVTPRKQERLRLTAQQWIAEHGDALDLRFDIIEIYTVSGEINHIENAFV
ncbi:MAG: YraN family protein [Clostridium sp. SCN 57-10]|nr:MAG: YraN family protein [Clostridium sp. SCN 57-10]